VEVLGEDTATGIHVGLHPIHRARMRNKSVVLGRIDCVFITTAIQQNHVVLVEVGLAVPKVRGGIQIVAGSPGHLIAGVRTVGQVVHADGSSPARHRELAGANADALKQALQPFGHAIVVRRVCVARSDRDLGQRDRACVSVV
jgi:hypothetical protein